MVMNIHPLQSRQWGEFRQKTGIKVIREKNFQLTIHKIPCLPAGKAHLPWTIGYIPKGPLPDKEMLTKLIEIGKQEKCIFIQLEPNIEKSQISNPKSQNDWKLEIGNWKLQPAAHPLFTRYTFILDLTKSEQELLADMHPKTRYNIRVALKHGVKIVEDNSDDAFETYLKLTKETTKRQGFYAHTENYHRLMWEALSPRKMENTRLMVRQGKSKMGNLDKDKLTAHLFLANYQPKINSQQPIPLVAWIVFVYGDTLYYPYGASSTHYREVMASNLMMWEVIKFGKKLGLKRFDMWGSLGPTPDPKDPWYGFHRFKQGYGPQLVEFIGSYDLVVNFLLYQVYKFLDKIRWFFLKLKF